MSFTVLVYIYMYDLICAICCQAAVRVVAGDKNMWLGASFIEQRMKGQSITSTTGLELSLHGKPVRNNAVGPEIDAM